MRKTDITKNAIITSTITLLRETGNANVKDICEKANVNIASINYHFSDKETLLEVVLRRLILDIKQKADAIIVDDKSNKEIIREFYNILISTVIENINVIKFVIEPQNKKYFDTCNKYFLSTFSSKTEFAHKLIHALNHDVKNDEIEPKYLALISTMLLPIMSKFDQIAKNSDRTLFPILDFDSINKYLDTILRIVQ